VSGPYRAVFLDVDGTLVSSGKRAVTDRDRAAVAAARASGLRVYLNTGRSTAGTLPLHEQLGTDAPVFTYNGAVVHDPDAGRDLLRHDVPEEVVRVTIRLADRHDAVVYCFSGGRILTHGHPDLLHGFFVERLSRSGVEELPDLAALPVAGVTKLWVLAPPDVTERVVEATAALRCRWIFPRFDSLPHAEETGRVLASGTGTPWLKRTALDWVAEHDGIPHAEMVAVGDHENDVEALEAAGLGVALAGSTPEALAAADRVIGAAEEDAVAGLLEELALGRG